MLLEISNRLIYWTLVSRQPLRERIDREQREKALREILAAKPTFTDVKDGTTFVRELRSVDKKRDARFGLL